jgi:hypothetical protein
MANLKIAGQSLFKPHASMTQNISVYCPLQRIALDEAV